MIRVRDLKRRQYGGAELSELAGSDEALASLFVEMVDAGWEQGGTIEGEDEYWAPGPFLEDRSAGRGGG